MKALIFTEGGRKIGFGHITRCLSLYDEFTKNGIETILIVAGDSSVLDLLKGKNFTIVNQLNEKIFINSSINFKLINIAVIDSYLATIHFYNECDKKIGLCVYIDDNNRLNYPQGVLINGDLDAENFHYPDIKNHNYLLGSKYILLPSEFRFVSKKNINKKLQQILITLGGTDLRNLTLPIIQLLATCYPNICKKVIVAPGYSNVEQIRKNASENTHIIYNPNMKKIKQLMLDSDIAISAGGQTVYELASTGTPAIIVGVAKNQLAVIKAFQRSGYIEYAGWWKSEQIFKNILNCIQNLKTFEERMKRSVKGVSLIDNQGAERIVKFIKNII